MRLPAMCLILIALCSSSCGSPASNTSSTQSVSKAAPPPPAANLAPAQIAPGQYFMSVNGHCADLGAGHASATHANVLWAPCNGTPWQRWSIEADPSRPNRYKVEWSSNSDKFWAPQDFNRSASNLAFGARTDTAFQAWEFSMQPDGGYQIINDGSGTCVQFPLAQGASTDMLLSACGGSGTSVGLQGPQ